MPNRKYSRVSRLLVKNHLADWHLAYRHLANRHLPDRHLADGIYELNISVDKSLNIFCGMISFFVFFPQTYNLKFTNVWRDLWQNDNISTNDREEWQNDCYSILQCIKKVLSKVSTIIVTYKSCQVLSSCYPGACIIKHYGSVLYGKMPDLRKFLKGQYHKKTCRKLRSHLP